jgi:hypothetical protein
MTKDDDLPAASGGAPSRRGLPGHGRKTAPIGTPVQKFPLEIPAAAPPAPPIPVAPMRSDRPPSSSQNTLSSPRTVGGHTARLLRGERDDDEPASSEPSRGPRPRVQDRSARARPPVDEDEETLSRSAKAKAEAEAARGGTLRMDAVDAPASVRAAPAPVPVPAPAPAPARKPPPVVTPPLSPEPLSEDPPSTARGGSAREFHNAPVYAARPAPVVHPVAAPPVSPVGASPAPPVVTSAPMGEITITSSEFESTAVPPAIESRWPFAFALGAVSLAVGSLLPLPFRQYIVPDRGVAAGASAPSSSAAASAAPVIAGPDLLRTATPVPRTAAPLPTLTTPTIGVAPPATSAVRPQPFGTVKPRPTSTTPRDVF